jgi:predicted RNA-binding Zn-ribbon protein involved in translation (DUF1610 family)
MSVKTEWEMACPKCGSDEDIQVSAMIWITLTEDGTEDNGGDTEWDNESLCLCGKCGHSGIVRDFECDAPADDEEEGEQ